MNINHIPTAVIHHRTFADRDRSEAEILVAHAVEGGPVTTAWHLQDDSGPRGRVIDAFLDLWSQHRDTGSSSTSPTSLSAISSGNRDRCFRD